MQSIYGLIDPRDSLVHYIGRAHDVFRRYAQHLNSPHPNAEKNAWMDSVKDAGMVPALRIFEQNIEDESASDREMYWITYHLERGSPLTNIVLSNPQLKHDLTKDTETFQHLQEAKRLLQRYYAWADNEFIPASIKRSKDVAHHSAHMLREICALTEIFFERSFRQDPLVFKDHDERDWWLYILNRQEELHLSWKDQADIILDMLNKHPECRFTVEDIQALLPQEKPVVIDQILLALCENESISKMPVSVYSSEGRWIKSYDEYKAKYLVREELP